MQRRDEDAVEVATIAGLVCSTANASSTGEQRSRARFAVHDAEALDLPRERFDVALCGWSL